MFVHVEQSIPYLDISDQGAQNPATLTFLSPVDWSAIENACPTLMYSVIAQ